MPNNPKTRVKPRSIYSYVILGAALFAFIHTFSLLSPIRELRNVIERAVILSERSTLPVLVGSAAVPAAVAPPPTLADAERTQILAALTDQPAHSWAGAAASLLGLKPTTPESRIQKLGLKRPR